MTWQFTVDGKGYYRRGMAQIELKLWRDAAETFTVAVKKQPKNPELQSRLSHVRVKMLKNDREVICLLYPCATDIVYASRAL